MFDSKIPINYLYNVPFNGFFMEHQLLAIIDDDLLFRHILNAQINRIKASERVITFENGLEAINYFRKAVDDSSLEIPSIIFLDLNMPVMNGWEFLDHFSELPTKVKEHAVIYIVTSSMVEEDMQRAKKYSDVSSYAVKPITPAQLQELIKEYKPKYS